MTWAPITMRWPAQATQWMGDLEAAQALAHLGTELQQLEGEGGRRRLDTRRTSAGAASGWLKQPGMVDSRIKTLDCQAGRVADKAARFSRSHEHFLQGNARFTGVLW